MTTPPDPLAQALRAALDDEPKPTGDDALIARAIGRALAGTATVAKKAESAGDATSAAAPPAETARPATPLVTSPADRVRPTATTSVATTSATAPGVPRDALAERRRTRALRYLLPLAAAFAATAAMAMVVGYGRTTQEPTRSPKPVEAPTAQPVVGALTAPALVVPAPSSEVKGLSVDDLPTAASVAPHPSLAPSASAKGAPPEITKTAAELFRDANAERRGGDVGKAVEAYRALLAQHPDAPESQASRVTLGRLLLDKQGKPALALVEFDAYLARGGDPALAEEARLGRATSLERLGRRAEERKAWEELLARHPNTLHAAHARARIDALDGDRPAVP